MEPVIENMLPGDRLRISQNDTTWQNFVDVIAKFDNIYIWVKTPSGCKTWNSTSLDTFEIVEWGRDNLNMLKAVECDCDPTDPNNFKQCSQCKDVGFYVEAPEKTLEEQLKEAKAQSLKNGKFICKQRKQIKELSALIDTVYEPNVQSLQERKEQILEDGKDGG